MSGLPSPAAPTALDFAAGLDRMMGDRAMYLRVLARFRSDYADNVARLRAALAAGDATLAHRIAHTLKGAAAMIEARGLRALALDVEQLLRAGASAAAPPEPPLPQLLDRLEAELARVMAQVDTLRAEPAAGPAGEAVLADREIAQLCALLDTGDSSALDVVAEKRAGLRARLGGTRMAELETAMAAFDFEHALSVLEATRTPGSLTAR